MQCHINAGNKKKSTQK